MGFGRIVSGEIIEKYLGTLVSGYRTPTHLTL
jgi:hypothetical protein